MQKPNYKVIVLTLGLIVISFLFVWYVFAQWTEPSAKPPNDNVAAPLNVSINAQAKDGALIIGANSSMAAVTGYLGSFRGREQTLTYIIKYFVKVTLKTIQLLILDAIL